MSAVQSFDVVPPPKLAWAFLIGLAVVLPMIVLAIVLAATPQAAGSAPRDAALALGVLALVGVPLALLMRRRSVELHQGTLVVKAAMYTRRVPVASMDLAHVRTLDLREHTKLMPRWKTNGYALPGFRAGHFRLRDGSAAFCLVTDTSRVLVVPVPGDRMLQLSLRQPSALLDALRRAAPERPASS